MSSALFQQVADATSGEYTLDAELGQSDALGHAFLAREAASGRSVVLVVPPGAESLDVVGALGDTIPADAGGCAACGFRVGTWVDACPRCDHSLLPPAAPSPDAGALAEQLRDSVEVLGALPHVRGGTMYFGREVSDGRLSAFVVRPQDDGQLALDVVWDVARPAEHAGVAPAVGRGGQASEAWRANDTAAQGGTFTPSADPAREYDGGLGDGGRRGGGRRWLPVGLGVGALALVAAAGFAFTHHDPPPKPVPIAARPDSIPLNGPFPGDSHAVRPAVPAPPPPTPTQEAKPVLTHADSIKTGLLQPTQAERAYMDSVRAARLAQRKARADSLAAAQGATLSIEGSLPNGWSAVVNGGGSTSSPDIHIPANTSVVVRVQAPGYCSDTLHVQLPPGGRKGWSPQLRGRSLVEEC